MDISGIKKHLAKEKSTFYLLYVRSNDSEDI